MHITPIKSSPFSGTDFSEVRENAYSLYQEIKKGTRRRPYIRAPYFNRDKVFLAPFWTHIFQKKNWRDRARRLKYFGCAIELLESKYATPITRQHADQSEELLHRFYGQTRDGTVFCVQVKERIRNKEKILLSVFPTKE